MSKVIRRGIAAAILILVVLLCIASGTRVVAAARAVTPMAGDFNIRVSAIETKSNKQYYGVDGCVYRVPVGELASEYITKIEYQAVRLKLDRFDEIEVDDDNKLVSDNEIIERVTVPASELVIYNNPKPDKYKYFELTATEWSAFVFTVYYDLGEGETASCGSDILYCRNIDSSFPEAYYSSWVYSGGYVLTVVVLGNRRSDNNKLTQNSGLQAFSVFRQVGNSIEKIDEVKDINGSRYEYKLSLGTVKATYYMDIIDRAGNGVAKQKIAEVTETTDDGLLNAIQSYITQIENDEDFSRALVTELKEAYYGYYLALQNNIDVEAARAAADAVKERVYLLTEMKRTGTKEFTVSNFNTDYFGGEIEILNSGAAYKEQKYGDRADYTLSVARYSLAEVKRDGAIKALGAKFSDDFYTVTVILSDGKDEIETEFAEALKLKLPKELTNARAVQSYVTADGTVYKECTVTVYSGYTVIEVPYSAGTVDIFFDGKSTPSPLWALMAIPGAGLVALAIVLVVKKGKRKPAADPDGKVDTDKNK